ncbi:response regulator [Pedobacter punctiformis]|uniref:Response regulator n=1 Tax=Pedobacter punctiformis TaxID=3004097 RepID=A0ABT4LAC4_9SPHI|nr:response regulator [Pedobacter sp. HCMS5-2]MCZ4244866.1 response regulator [Pedobacter sp. HCMS5-2]
MSEKMILNNRPDNVLLISESQETEKLISAYLFDAEIEFNVAESIEDACELLKKNKFKLILLDIHLNDLNELYAIKMLKDKNINVPIVVLTDELQGLEVGKYFNLGISGCISKPVSKMDLAGITTQFLQYEYAATL